jgi:hypothetical protein
MVLDRLGLIEDNSSEEYLVKDPTFLLVVYYFLLACIWSRGDFDQW